MFFGGMNLLGVFSFKRKKYARHPARFVVKKTPFVAGDKWIDSKPPKKNT